MRTEFTEYHRIIHKNDLQHLKPDEKTMVYQTYFKIALEQLVDDSESGVIKFFVPQKGSEWYSKEAGFVVITEDERQTGFYVTPRTAKVSQRRNELQKNGVVFYQLMHQSNDKQTKPIADIKNEVLGICLPFPHKNSPPGFLPEDHIA